MKERERYGRFFSWAQVQKQEDWVQFQMRTLIFCLLIALSLSIASPNEFKPSSNLTQCKMYSLVDSSTIINDVALELKRLGVNQNSIQLLLNCRTTPNSGILGGTIANLFIYSSSKGIISIRLDEKQGQLVKYNLKSQILLDANKIDLINKPKNL